MVSALPPLIAGDFDDPAASCREALLGFSDQERSDAASAMLFRHDHDRDPADGGVPVNRGYRGKAAHGDDLVTDNGNQGKHPSGR